MFSSFLRERVKRTSNRDLKLQFSSLLLILMASAQGLALRSFPVLGGGRRTQLWFKCLIDRDCLGISKGRCALQWICLRGRGGVLSPPRAMNLGEPFPKKRTPHSGDHKSGTGVAQGNCFQPLCLSFSTFQLHNAPS